MYCLGSSIDLKNSAPVWLPGNIKCYTYVCSLYLSRWKKTRKFHEISLDSAAKKCLLCKRSFNVLQRRVSI